MTRRESLRIGALGASSLFVAENAESATIPSKTLRRTPRREGFSDQLEYLIRDTAFIDTHEHLLEESGRFTGTDHPLIGADDWSILFSHYLDSDLRTSGMPESTYQAFFGTEVSPVDKWKLLEPYWPRVKNTGYGLAVRRAVKTLYGIEDISGTSVRRLQDGYDSLRKPGFYERILQGVANIESCQVNTLEGIPFMETASPKLLMQDLAIHDMFGWIDVDKIAAPTGISVADLDDYHRVIDWWFNTYGRYAVAVKSANAYTRDIDYAQVSADAAAGPFKKMLDDDPISEGDRKDIEDHLFWYAVDKATEYDLPVKLHTGYYAGDNTMPLGRLIHNAGSASDLCRLAPDTTFVFMHLCYPYYEELLTVAKQYTNACLDMCWGWIINPVAAKDFLKKYIVTAPANKVLTLGGDYIPVEPVVGHAEIARKGIYLALSELVDEGWISDRDALDLVPEIMNGNAKTLFRLSAKEKALDNVPWG